MNRPPHSLTIIGTGFGSGFWLWKPGAVGALGAASIWLALSYTLSFSLQLAVATPLLIVLFAALEAWATKEIVPFRGKRSNTIILSIVRWLI